MATPYQPGPMEKHRFVSFGAVVAFCLAVFLLSNQFDKYYQQNQQNQIDYRVKDTLVVTSAFSDINGIVSASIVSEDKDGVRYNDLFRGDRYAARTRAGDTIVVERAYSGKSRCPNMDKIVYNSTLAKLQSNAQQLERE